MYITLSAVSAFAVGHVRQAKRGRWQESGDEPQGRRALSYVEVAIWKLRGRQHEGLVPQGVAVIASHIRSNTAVPSGPPEPCAWDSAW